MENQKFSRGIICCLFESSGLEEIVVKTPHTKTIDFGLLR